MGSSKKPWLVICLAIVLGFSAIKAEAATLSAILNKTVFRIGDTFTASVIIDSQDAGINAAQGTVTFSPDILTAISADKSSSVFDFWLNEPSIDNTGGKITFTAAAIAGVSGKTLKVLDISFKVKGTGSSTIGITDAAVSASDGSGTNVLNQVNAIQFTSSATGGVNVIPPQIAGPSQQAQGLPATPVIKVNLYPDPNGWYNEIGPFLAQWNLSPDVSGVATALDKIPLTNPAVSEGLFNNKSFDSLSDGIWYLHVRFKNSLGWGTTAHYRIAIDTNPPAAFTASVKEGLSTSVSTPTLLFESRDPVSGVPNYEVYVDNELVGTTATTTLILPALAPGNHAIVVKAVDAAGNKTESRLSLSITRPPFLVIYNFPVSDWLFFVIVFGLIGVGVGLGIRINKKAKTSRRGQLFITRRDIESAFGEIIRDIEKVSAIYEKGAPSEQKMGEIKFTLGRISDTINKMKGYISSEVEEIED